MNMVEGRYYLGMWYLETPEINPPHGANLMLMFSRELEDQTGRWALQYRHRYYCGEEMTPATLIKSGDRFSWYQGTAEGTEAQMIQKAEDFMKKISSVVSHNAERFLIQGDVHHFQQLIFSGKGPSWIQATRVEGMPQ